MLNLLSVAAASTPPFFSTLFNHNNKKSLERSAANRELKYALSWKLVKSFLEQSTHNTVESLQKFCNTISPQPKFLVDGIETAIIPSSVITRAAGQLIQAFGGIEVMERVVGGTTWWQERESDEIYGEFFFKSEAKKDTPTIFYINGGGYYFGSLATHRFMIRKIAKDCGLTAFSFNYRHAPQYPFPCGLHDCLAAYLYLIDPPAGSSHDAVDPSRVIIAGDSAGGGLALALLQVIRSGGHQMPAGCILISPWADLTHSFPSVNENSSFDIIPPYSFIHKPSLAWPPREPSSLPPFPTQDLTKSTSFADPLLSSSTTALLLQLESKENLEIKTQIQLYAPNHLLAHPFVSPIVADLRLSLPMLVICSAKESLRDEAIFLAHRAAGWDGIHVRKEVEEKCPELYNNSQSWNASRVHLQVYDEASHILPVYSYTKIAQKCYSTITSFAREVTSPSEAATSPYVSNMIRERVGIRGNVRELESIEELSAFSIPKEEIGVIQAVMVHRFLEGRHKWADKYRKVAAKVEVKRDRLEKKWRIENREEIDLLAGEHPPISAIAGRRDSAQAQKLAKRKSNFQFFEASPAPPPASLPIVDSGYSSTHSSPVL